MFFTETKCFDLMFSRALNQDSWSISQEKVLARYANFLLCGLNFFDWILFFSLFLSVKEISLLVVWCHFAKTTPHKFMSHIRGPQILLGKRGNFICTTNKPLKSQDPIVNFPPPAATYFLVFNYENSVLDHDNNFYLIRFSILVTFCRIIC